MMKSMTRGTTPTHVFTIPFEADMIEQLRVIYAQGAIKLVKTEGDYTVSGNTFSVTLSQEETFAFEASEPVDIQVRALTKDGKALASQVMRVRVERCLETEVLV